MVTPGALVVVLLEVVVAPVPAAVPLVAVLGGGEGASIVLAYGRRVE